MEPHHKVKRFKYDTLVVYPDSSEVRSKTELYLKQDEVNSPDVTPQPPIDHVVNPPIELPAIHSVDGNLNSYQQRILDETEAWDKSRATLLQVHFSNMVPKDEELCAECSNEINEDDHMRCLDCSLFFCSSLCICASHNGTRLPLHKPETWKANENAYVDYNADIFLDRPYHKCKTKKEMRAGIRIFDAQGRLHTVNVAVCACEKDHITFLRHNIWASSANSPSMGFHVNLLKWIEFLMVESRVSLIAICQSIRWKNNLTVAEFNSLYRGLVGETMEQFRHFSYQTRTLEFVSAQIKEDITCPACPVGNGDRFISLDANFGLVRKNNAGTSAIGSKHKQKIFVDDATDKELATRSDKPINKKNECSNFQAANDVRSKNKTSKLDITGVFGSCCRHGVPHTFINLDRGERLCYAIYVVDKLLDEVSGTNVKLHVLYDIACVLESHVKAMDNAPNYDKVSFAVPIFHAYGHKASCQVKYSTRWLPGFGMTDGEEMERIWAFLRRFSYITKEMTPTHRIDLLTDGLLHYRRKKVTDLDLTLAKHMDKSLCVLRNTKADIQNSCSKLQIPLTTVDQWVTVDKRQFARSIGNDEKASNEEEYVQILMSLSSINGTMCLTEDPETQVVLQEKQTRLKADKNKMEKKLGVTRQWQQNSSKFIQHKLSLERKKKLGILQKLHSHSMEYRFVLNLKKKYSDGQAIAKRLAKRVRNVAKMMKTAIKAHNNACEPEDHIRWNNAVDPSGDIYKAIQHTSDEGDNTNIPSSVRDQLVDLKNRQDRAMEEISIIETEMQSLLKNLEFQYGKYIAVMKSERLEKGVLLAVVHVAECTRKSYIRASNIFSKFIKTPPMPTHFVQAADHELHVSDSDLADQIDGLERQDEDEDDHEDEDILEMD